MMSTPAQRLQAIHDSYSKAYQRRRQDRKEAPTDDAKEAVSANVRALELTYLRAARQALDANSDAVEAAYGEAKKAQKEVDEAYQEAKSIPEKIRLVTSVVRSVGDLLEKAKGAKA